jgi:hypothetical protein
MLARIWAKVFSQAHVALSSPHRFNPSAVGQNHNGKSAKNGADRGCGQQDKK